MKYRCILADPPWQYENKKTGGTMKSGAVQHYPTMPLESIKALPIDQLLADECALFLWATTPLLPEAISVLSAWGFEYKTAIYWRKIMSAGMGWWFRGQVQVLLVGVRGSVKPFRAQKPNFIQSKSRRHSQKPIEAYELIELACKGPRVELFAREKREGWDAWGNEITSDIQLVQQISLNSFDGATRD